MLWDQSFRKLVLRSPRDRTGAGVCIIEKVGGIPPLAWCHGDTKGKLRDSGIVSKGNGLCLRDLGKFTIRMLQDGMHEAEYKRHARIAIKEPPHFSGSIHDPKSPVNAIPTDVRIPSQRPKPPRRANVTRTVAVLISRAAEPSGRCASDEL
jgi:hypothetical protein